jgi:hypothetical protein
MKGIVPEASGVRAHCLIRGTPYLQAYKKLGIHYDSSDLFDGVPGLRVFESWTGIKRVPIFFEDDVHLARGIGCSLDQIDLDQPGLKVFNFHPVLVALNSTSAASYGALKESLQRSGRPLIEASLEDFRPHSQSSAPGVQDLLVELLSFMKNHPERCPGSLNRLAQ